MSKEQEKIMTRIRLQGSTRKLVAACGEYKTITYLRVSKNGKIEYEERSPLGGTVVLGKLAASAPGFAVEIERTTTRSGNELSTGTITFLLDHVRSTPLRPTVIVTSWYSTKEAHYHKVGTIKDFLLDLGFIPEGGKCQITTTVDC